MHVASVSGTSSSAAGVHDDHSPWRSARHAEPSLQSTRHRQKGRSLAIHENAIAADTGAAGSAPSHVVSTLGGAAPPTRARTTPASPDPSGAARDVPTATTVS